MPSPTPHATPQSTPSPQATPTPAKSLDVTGTWVGKDGRNNRMTLVISSQNGDSFSGVISDKKNRVALTGSANSETRQISMKDTNVITPKNSTWSLGAYNGSVSSDGKKMSLKIKDGYGTTAATFFKQ